MRQRVGFARALVVHPNILLMDEPFSALDVLTAETLRTDFLDLWCEGRLPIKGVILVTHNIEEAVLMCDRILVFSHQPGRIVERDQGRSAAAAQSARSGVPRPGRAHLRRDDGDVAGRAARVRHLRSSASRATASTRSCRASPPTCCPASSRQWRAPPYNGMADLPVIASIAADGGRRPVPGRRDAADAAFRRDRGRRHPAHRGGQAVRRSAPSTSASELFQRQLLALRAARSPHPARARRARVPRRAEEPLPRRARGPHGTEEAAEQTLRAVISWGRYAEAFAYDDQTERFSLENPT